MARPVKQGLDYFPLDVDFFNDYKVMDLLNEHGPLGVNLYLCILTEIYRDKGYYLEVPLEQLASKLVRVIGNRWVKDKNLVMQVILSMADIGLFHKGLLSKGVITSAGVQIRYSEVTARNKVKKDKYWLLDVSDSEDFVLNEPIIPISATETPVITTETPVHVVHNQQRKEKKKKVNETKEKERKESAPAALVGVSPEVLSALEEFKEMRKKIKSPMTERAVSLLLSQLDKLASTDEEKILVINQSIMNGWKSVYPLKEQKKDKPSQADIIDQWEQQYGGQK